MDNVKSWISNVAYKLENSFGVSKETIIRAGTVILVLMLFFRIDNPISNALFELLEKHLPKLAEKDGLIGTVCKALLKVISAVLSLVMGKDRFETKLPNTARAASVKLSSGRKVSYLL